MQKKEPMSPLIIPPQSCYNPLILCNLAKNLSMQFSTINPWNLQPIETFNNHTDAEANSIIEAVDSTFHQWKKTTFEDRASLLLKVGEVLLKNKQTYAEHITEEMGKPILESVAEVEKCAWVCTFYAENAAKFLAHRLVETDASKSFVRYDPLGVIYAIMPWNFPFWQVLRFAAPTLMAGNTAILKHAPNVTRCALDIEEAFIEAEYPQNAFRTLVLSNEQASAIIKHPKIRAVSLTGSERAGEAVASTAGSVLKPSVLELGGSNAVIVLKDADVDAAVDTGFRARFLNSGQSCIAGKRFLVSDEIHDEYVEKFMKRVEDLKFNDPTDASTKIGPLARVDLAEGIEIQVNGSLEKGAVLKMGGQRDGAKYDATVLTNVKPGMPAFDEELFGPVAPFIRIKNLD